MLQDASSRSYASALLWHGGFQALQMQRTAHAFWKKGDRTAAFRIQARWRCCTAMCSVASGPCDVLSPPVC